MGTFSITTPVTVGTKTVQETHEEVSVGTSDADLITGLLGNGSTAILGYGADINSNTAVSGVLRFGFDQTTAIIKLDGNPAISFNSLPAGFTPSTAILSVTSGATEGYDGVHVISNNLLYLQLGAGIESTAFLPDNSITTPASLSYAVIPSMLDIILNGFGFRWAWNATPNFPEADIPANSQFGYTFNYSFTGTYSIIPTACYFNSLTNHYKFASVDPGPPWVLVPAPTPGDTSVTPAKGPTTGGTVI